MNTDNVFDVIDADSGKVWGRRLTQSAAKELAHQLGATWARVRYSPGFEPAAGERMPPAIND